jgi:hypothetical protein
VQAAHSYWAFPCRLLLLCTFLRITVYQSVCLGNNLSHWLHLKQHQQILGSACPDQQQQQLNHHQLVLIDAGPSACSTAPTALINMACTT